MAGSIRSSQREGSCWLSDRRRVQGKGPGREKAGSRGGPQQVELRVGERQSRSRGKKKEPKNYDNMVMQDDFFLSLIIGRM